MLHISPEMRVNPALLAQQILSPEENYLYISEYLMAAIGVEEALFVTKLSSWCKSNRRLDKDEYYEDEYWWTRGSYEYWCQTTFGYLGSPRTIQRMALSLEEKGILISSNFNKKASDRSKWYRVNNEAIGAILIRFEDERRKLPAHPRDWTAKHLKALRESVNQKMDEDFSVTLESATPSQSVVPNLDVRNDTSEISGQDLAPWSSEFGTVNMPKPDVVPYINNSLTNHEQKEEENNFFVQESLLQQEGKTEQAKEDDELQQNSGQRNPVAQEDNCPEQVFRGAGHENIRQMATKNVSHPNKLSRKIDANFPIQRIRDHHEKRGFEASALNELGIWSWQKYAEDPIMAIRLLGKFQAALTKYFREDGRTHPDLLTNTIVKHMRERDVESTHWEDWLAERPLWATEKKEWTWIDPKTGQPNPLFLQDRLETHMSTGGGGNSSLDRVEAAKRAAKEMRAEVDGGVATVNLMYENWLRRLDRRISDALVGQENGSLSAAYLKELRREEPIDQVRQRLSGNISHLLTGAAELYKVHSLGSMCKADSNAVISQARNSAHQTTQKLMENPEQARSLLLKEESPESPDEYQGITITQESESTVVESAPISAWDAERLKTMKIMQGFLNHGMANVVNMQPTLQEWKLHIVEGIILPIDEKPPIEYLTFLLQTAATEKRIEKLVNSNGWWGYIVDGSTIEEY
jgi:hypothetical protein